MLHIKPLIDDDACDTVAAVYKRIRIAFKLDITPLFFQYMGNFPDFLEFIWQSIEENLEGPKIEEVVKECKDTSLTLFKQAYKPSQTATTLLQELLSDKISLSFIQLKIDALSTTNAAIAVLFVAMREAIKGWALSTKLLKDKYEDARFEQVTRSVEKEMETSLVSQPLELEAANKTQQFDYMKFMAIVQSEVDDSLKKEAHLHARLALEEFLVGNKDEVAIDLSYRILAQYAASYKYFDELVYLLSESFPTIAATRVIVSSIGTILINGITSPLTVHEGS